MSVFEVEAKRGLYITDKGEQWYYHVLDGPNSPPDPVDEYMVLGYVKDNPGSNWKDILDELSGNYDYSRKELKETIRDLISRDDLKEE
jgi:uncharacterized glyoxalase superfamily metalloenzyme YdcJ